MTYDFRRVAYEAVRAAEREGQNEAVVFAAPGRWVIPARELKKMLYEDRQRRRARAR